MKACKECAKEFGGIDYIFWPYHLQSHSINGLVVPKLQIAYCPACGEKLLEVKITVIE